MDRSVKLITLKVVVILIHLVTIEAQLIYRQEVDGIKFKKVSNYSVIPPEEYSYFDMKFDEFIPGNILFRSSNAFWTASLETQIADPIVGADSVYGYQEGTGIYAWFKAPRHLQWNETSLLIIDSDVPRVRIVSRLTNTSSTVIGDCNPCPYAANGSFLTQKIGSLHAIAKVPTQPNAAYVIQGFQGMILKLDFDTQSFSPLDLRIPFVGSDSDLKPLLTSHPTEPVLYFYSGFEGPYSGALGSINVLTGVRNILIPSKAGSEGLIDGPLHLSLIGGAASSLVFLTDNILMLSVRYGRRNLRVIDLTTNMTSSVCKPDSTSSSPDCDVLSSKPQSLLVDKEKDRVIIGHQGYLSYLQLDGLNNITETTTAMTTTTSLTTTKPQTSTDVPATSGPARNILIIGVSLSGVGFIMLVTSIALIACKLRVHRMNRSKEEPTVEFSTERSEPDRDYEEVPGEGNHQYEACNSGRDMMTHAYVNLTLADRQSQTGEESDPSYLNMSPQ